MKSIILNADGARMIYSVPDAVADNLDKYCLEFCSQWLKISPHAEKYRININGFICYSYTEADFIDYLNQWRFPEEQSVFVKNLGIDQPIPEQYQNCPYFGF